MKLGILLPAILPLIPSVAASDKAAFSLGCFGDVGELNNLGSFKFQSVNYCADVCGKDGYEYAAVQGDYCWCGSSPPAEEDIVSDDKCNEACAGYPVDICGGDDAWSVYKIGNGVRPTEWSTTSTSTSTRLSTTSKEPVTISTTTSSAVSITSLLATSTPTAKTNTESASSTPSESNNVFESPASSSTSLEPTPTNNSATRRYRIFFL